MKVALYFTIEHKITIKLHSNYNLCPLQLSVGFLIFISAFHYMLVALSFLALRKKEPDMPRPYKIKHGKTIGVLAIALSLFLFILYLPGSPAALSLPYEWGIILIWIILGTALYSWAKLSKSGNSDL